MALHRAGRQKGRMTMSADEPSAALSSIDSIKAYLAGVVTAASQNRGPKVELTYVGGEFRRLAGASFDRHLNRLAEQDGLNVPKTKRKLADFIETYCADLIARERSAAGTWLVYPVVHPAPAEDPIAQTGSSAVLRFKPAVWAAFLRPVAAGRRYLNLEQIGFTDTDTPPSTGLWKEIDRQYILGVAPDAPVDGAKVQSQIEAWASAAAVPVSILMVSAAKDVSRPLRQLLDLIDTLPAEIAVSWTIPAAVLKHLARAR